MRYLLTNLSLLLVAVFAWHLGGDRFLHIVAPLLRHWVAGRLHHFTADLLGHVLGVGNGDLLAGLEGNLLALLFGHLLAVLLRFIPTFFLWLLAALAPAIDSRTFILSDGETCLVSDLLA